MRLFGFLMSIALVATLFSCEHPDQTSNKKYPPLESLTDTRWYSVDTKRQIYYDIDYAETAGLMVGYSNSLREEEVSRRGFTYTFTPANEKVDGIVSVVFEDGQRYGGMLIPKGQFQVNNNDVYWIQLYEVDDEGYIIYDDNGQIKSSILMWKE